MRDGEQSGSRRGPGPRPGARGASWWSALGAASLPARRGGAVRTIALALLCGAALGACRGHDEPRSAESPAASTKNTALARADRRAYDGAPPIIPHPALGAACVACHNETGLSVPGLGFAPPQPHAATAGMGPETRCEQCHVFRTTADVFAASSFRGLPQDLRRGSRLYEHAPPRLPHPVFMHEGCVACHTGPAAREEIRCSHPERERCLQCHVPVSTEAEFSRGTPTVAQAAH